MSKKLNTLADLSPDAANANRGTKRGLGLLDNSLRQYGAGRSILADKNGVIIAGNKTLERAADIGLPVRVVETDGRELVVVQRTDLDIDTKQGRAMAYADNRVAQVDLDWNPDQLLADVNAGVDLEQFFRKDELDEILRQAAAPDWKAGMDGLPTEDRAPFQQMTFTLHDSQCEQVKAALTAAQKMGAFVNSPNENGNGNALARICETFLTIAGHAHR